MMGRDPSAQTTAETRLVQMLPSNQIHSYHHPAYLSNAAVLPVSTGYSPRGASQSWMPTVRAAPQISLRVESWHLMSLTTHVILES